MFEQTLPGDDYTDKGEEGSEGGSFVRCYHNDETRYDVYKYYIGGEDHFIERFDNFDDAEKCRNNLA